ncbi:hypothetical protein [Azotobacter vinelandii]
MELIEALNGGKGALDCWLEVRSEVEVMVAIKALISPEETLRDKFAAKAMQSYIARANYGAGNDQAARRINSECARAAYDMADAMLEARNA